MSDTVVLEKIPVTRADVMTEIGPYRRQRVYIFLTRQGLFFSGLLLVMLIGAINYSNSMAYVLTFLLGSILMVGMLHTYRNLRGLIIRVQPAQPVFAGELLRLPLLIDNRTGSKRIALKIESNPKTRKKRRHKNREVLTVNIDADRISRVKFSLKTERRGYLYPGRLKITSTFPLGLFRAWSYIESDRYCIVYPRPAGTHRLPAYTEYDMEDQIGRKSGTDDFTGFKPYRHGDSIRNIDWKAFAKELPLQVKRFQGSGSSKLVLRWDHCVSFTDMEPRLSQLCLWVLTAERERLHYGLDIPGTYIEPGNGERHKEMCLTTLACYGLSENRSQI